MTMPKPNFPKDINESILICRICSKRYRDAKLLPCLHSFCKSCLEPEDTSGELCCSVCSRVHKLPFGGVGELTTNHFGNELVKQLPDENEQLVIIDTCGGCEVGKATIRCVDCAVFLCAICERQHRRLNLTKSHCLMSLEEYLAKLSSDIASVLPPIHCAKHSYQSVTFYCDTCDDTICVGCTVMDHPAPQHEHKYLHELAEAYREKLREVVSNVAHKEKEVTVGKHNVQQLLKSLNARFLREDAKVKQHVENTIEEKVKRIKESGNQLSELLKHAYESKRKELETQYRKLSSSESDFMNAREYTEHLMHYGNDTQLMAAKKLVQSHILELISHEVDIEAVKDDSLEFQPNTDTKNDESLGIIITADEKVTYL
ncbi:E3 ubiquitin-protein ligase TRIM45-like [Glandiceps talaboti]